MEEEVLLLEVRASLGEDPLEEVEVEVRVILKVTNGRLVVPAGVGAGVDVKNGLEGVLRDGGGVAEEGVEEGDMGEEVAEDILELNLTEVKLVTKLGENVHGITVEGAEGVGVVDGPPEGHDVEGLNVEVDLADVVATDVEGEANVGLGPELELNPVVNNEGAGGINSSGFLFGDNSVAEIEIVVEGELILGSGVSISK